MRNRAIIATIVAMNLLIAIAVAADTVPTYKKGQFIQGYREAVAIVDSASLESAGVKAVPFIDAGLNQVVRVDLKMSASAATCKIHFVRSNGIPGLEWRGPFSVTSSTASADAVITSRGRYVADSIAFDMGSYRYCKVLVEAPSSGNVDIDIVVCGERAQ